MANHYDYFRNSSWRDILRPIRDGLDNIRERIPDLRPYDPTEDNLRKRKRQDDALQGFAYIESFDDLLSWRPEHADPIQKSSTPLLQRTASLNPTKDQPPGAKELVCHDCSGGHHPYEAIVLNQIEQEVCSLEYLQFVETFVYFSHRLVTIPPPSWTNTLHLNGVLSLGTFIVEPGTKRAEEIFHYTTNSDSTKYFPVAEQLAAIAEAYGFDGWLINIEKTFTQNSWDLDAMIGFLKALRGKMGPTRKLVWYDSLTVGGRVRYQNALTYSNLPFFETCGNILTNYAWEPSMIEMSKAVAKNSGVSVANIYFGVDVWAQNKPVDKYHPRVSFPQNRGGGGTNTGVAVSECRNQGVSSGIFAPAWAYEHFKLPEDGPTVSRCMWEGEPLPKEVECECYGGRPNAAMCHFTHRTDASITRSALEYPAGSEDFFWTDFCKAFSQRTIRPDSSSARTEINAHLGSQSVLPRQWRAKNEWRHRQLTMKLIGHNPSRAVIGLPRSDNVTETINRMELFALRLRIPHKKEHKQLQITIHYNICQLGHRVNLIIHKSNGESPITQTLPSDQESTTIVLIGGPPHSNNDEQEYVTSIGIATQGGHQSITFPPSQGPRLNPEPIVEITNIRACHTTTEPDDGETVDICLDDDDSPPKALSIQIQNVPETPYMSQHIRVSWELNNTALNGPDDGLLVPRSKLTGQMAYFNVWIDDEFLTRVYGLEMVLPRGYIERWQSYKGIRVRVDCVRFGGEVWEGSWFALTAADAEWVVVDGDV